MKKEGERKGKVKEKECPSSFLTLHQPVAEG